MILTHSIDVGRNFWMTVSRTLQLFSKTYLFLVALCFCMSANNASAEERPAQNNLALATSTYDARLTEELIFKIEESWVQIMEILSEFGSVRKHGFIMEDFIGQKNVTELTIKTFSKHSGAQLFAGLAMQRGGVVFDLENSADQRHKSATNLARLLGRKFDEINSDSEVFPPKYEDLKRYFAKHEKYIQLYWSFFANHKNQISKELQERIKKIEDKIMGFRLLLVSFHIPEEIFFYSEADTKIITAWDKKTEHHFLMSTSHESDLPKERGKFRRNESFKYNLEKSHRFNIEKN